MSISKVEVIRDKKTGFWRISLEPLNGFAPNSRERRVPRSDEFVGPGQFRRPACGLCLEKHLCSSSFFATERLNIGALLPLRQLSYASGLDALVLIGAVNNVLYNLDCVLLYLHCKWPFGPYEFLMNGNYNIKAQNY